MYLNFGAYVESYGINYNRELAIKRAVIGAAKCTMMGAEYLNHDRLADCTEHLKVFTEYEDEFVEAWSQFERSEESPNDGDDGGGGDGGGDGSGKDDGGGKDKVGSQIAAARRATEKLIAKRGGGSANSKGRSH